MRVAEIENDLDNLDLGISDIKTLLDPVEFLKKVSQRNEAMHEVIAKVGIIEQQLREYDEQVFSLIFSYKHIHEL